MDLKHEQMKMKFCVKLEKGSSSADEGEADQERNLELVIPSIFSYDSIVHREFIPQGQTVNVDFYVYMFSSQATERILGTNDLQHDTMAIECSNMPMPRLKAEVARTDTHPPCSPNFAPCNFFLSPRFISELKGCCFTTVTEIQTESQTALDSLEGSDFHKAVL